MVQDAGALLEEVDHFILRINVMNVESVDIMLGIVPDTIRDQGAGHTVGAGLALGHVTVEPGLGLIHDLGPGIEGLVPGRTPGPEAGAPLTEMAINIEEVDLFYCSMKILTAFYYKLLYPLVNRNF